jgi:hypothetical protein
MDFMDGVAFMIGWMAVGLMLFGLVALATDDDEDDDL